jgi:hypothetical protein
MNWNYFYKFDEGHDGAPTNVLYEPYVSEDKKLFRMKYTNKSDYFINENYHDGMVDFFFRREASYIQKFVGCDFTPELIDIDYKTKEIIYKWYDKNLNRGVYGKEFNLPDNWHQQVKDVIKKLDNVGVFKLNLYPNTFYFDEDGNLRVSDMYACIDNDDYYVAEEIIKPVLDPTGGVGSDRFTMFTEDGLVNLKKVYEYTMSINYGKWPEDFLNG